MSPQIELDSFVRWNQENIERVSVLYGEIEEIQEQFNGLYSELLATWQARVESTSLQLVQRSELPVIIAAALEVNTRMEQAKLEKRISELRDILDTKQRSVDASLHEAQEELARLKEVNPALDAQEEELKARSLRENEKIGQLEDQLRSVGLLGRLFGQGDLKQKLRSARTAHSATIAELAAVREKWVQKKKEVEAHQAEIRKRWQEESIAISETRSELDYSVQNLDHLAKQRGAQAYLAGLATAPEEAAELREEFSVIAEQNERLAAYRDGLASVAEALGLLTGIRGGLQRFDESASKVLEEQTRYNLAKLRLDVPKSAVQLHNTWAEFRKRVRNEKRMGRHPLEFVEIIRDYGENRLTETAIQEMFENMGRALTDATKAWS